MEAAMKQKTFFIILTFFILHFTFHIRLLAEDTWVQTYQPFYNPAGDNDYYVEDIRVCPDGGFAVTGYYSYFDDWEEYKWAYLMKTDSDGNFLWAKKDTVSFYSETESTAFVVLDDGSFICVGKNAWIGGGHYFVKRDSNGDRQWVLQSNPDYSIEAMELTDNGNLITTGSSMDDTINLQKFDLNGSLIWRQTYLPTGFDYGGGNSVIQTSDGGYALTGSVHDTNNNDIIVIKTNGIGDSLWTWTYNGTENYRDVGNCIIENSFNELLVGGYISEINNRDYFGFLIKMNTIGDTIWTRRFDTNNETSNLWSLLQYEDDNYIVRSTKIIIIDENQNIIWDSVIDWGLTFGYASGDRSIQKLQDNQYICCGEKNINGSSIIVSKTDSTGNVVSTEDFEILPTTYNGIICYPNPFNPSTTIEFSIQIESYINLSIYNIKGQKVKTIVDTKLEKGIHEVVWNGRNEHNKPVASGVYFYKLRVNGRDYSIKKCLMLK